MYLRLHDEWVLLELAVFVSVSGSAEWWFLTAHVRNRNIKYIVATFLLHSLCSFHLTPFNLQALVVWVFGHRPACCLCSRIKDTARLLPGPFCWNTIWTQRDISSVTSFPLFPSRVSLKKPPGTTSSPDDCLSQWGPGEEDTFYRGTMHLSPTQRK